MASKVVIPIDFNPNTNKRALELALQYSNSDAEMYMVTVNQSGSKDGRENDMRDGVVDEVQEYLEKVGYGDRTVNFEVLSGKVAREVCEFSDEKDADLIAMTTEGHSGFKRLVVSSVSQKIIQNSSCPVLVVNNKNQ